MKLTGQFCSLLLALLSLGASAATVGVGPGYEGMGSVVSSESRKTDGTSRLTLKATAETGYAFWGWSVAEKDVVSWSEDLRCPGPLSVIVASNACVVATFVACADDCLSFDISNDFPEELSCDEDVSVTLVVDSLSYPTVSFRNLPPGLSFDNRTLTVFGRPNAPGIYRVEASAVNESGFTYRSFCTIRVLNVDSARVTGIDTEIPVDEYFYAEIGADDVSDLFSFSEPPTSVSLTGTVPGLTWADDWSLLCGTPTEPGEYTLRVSARFPTGAVETATMTLTVAGDDPEEFGLVLDDLEDLQIGDTLDESCEIGVDSQNTVIRSIGGLPTGLKAVSRYEGGSWRWFVTGTVAESGFFTVTVQVEDLSGDSQRLARVVRTVTVVDVPDVYLSVTSSDAAHGTVSGGGAVPPYKTVTLVATPRSGYVFSGWHDPDGERLVLLDGTDYRTPSVTLPAGTSFAFLAPVAHFASEADDVAPDLSELEDAEFSFPPDESFQTEFAVESVSLPTLTLKGLPKGMSCSASGSGGHVLAYDPWTAVAASGRYAVTATAVNESGRKSTVSFRITVETRSDARVHVYDDYGEFSPGEEIDPIDLTDAVDFARGETLSVSGLPRGLAYNAKANEKKGIEANTITGTPAVPGDYTLTFTAKVVSGATTNRTGKVSLVYETAKATSFLTVLPYPALEIDVDGDAAAAGCKVTGAGNYRPGTKVSLKATAAKGWVFAGWEGLDDVGTLEALNPKLSVTTGSDDVWASAVFLPVHEDWLFVNEPPVSSAGFAAELALKENVKEDVARLVADLLDSGSWPTVKVSGLPPGVKFSATTFLLSGKPTKSGVFPVTVTAKNAGGYSFVRVFNVAVLNADGSQPTEKPLENPAEVAFAPLGNLTTGAYCPTGAVVLAVGPRPVTGSEVKKVAVSGLPPGLAASVKTGVGTAQVEVTGTPTTPGRFVVTVSVTYADGKTLKSQAAVVVADGGSRYLFVSSSDADGGTVSGEGVYAAGATVKLVAKAKPKQVFAGWQVADEEGDLSLFSSLRDRDGVDPRTPTVSFLFRPADFAGSFEMFGLFAASGKDVSPTILLEDDVWEIDPSESSAFAFAVQSLSVPKVTVSGLPKGVTVDAVGGTMSYAPTASVLPGIYSATLSAKNATVTKATVRTVEIRVANRVSDEIGGLDPAMDAYPLTVGVSVDPASIIPEVGEGWSLSVKGLPSGMSFVGGAVTGVPSKAGDYTVTFTATTGKGASKRTELATIMLRVAAFPTQATGTYTGLVTDGEGVLGTLTFSAPANGKVSAKVQVPGRTWSYSGKAWESFGEGVAMVRLETKDGASLSVRLETVADWTDWQLEATAVLEGVDCRIRAQRDPFGEKDGSSEARAALQELVGTHKTAEGWTVKIDRKGVVSMSGRHDGKTVSGSTTLQYDGSFMADLVKFPDRRSLLWLHLSIGENGFAIAGTERRL